MEHFIQSCCWHHSAESTISAWLNWLGSNGCPRCARTSWLPLQADLECLQGYYEVLWPSDRALLCTAVVLWTGLCTTTRCQWFFQRYDVQSDFEYHLSVLLVRNWLWMTLVAGKCPIVHLCTLNNWNRNVMSCTNGVVTIQYCAVCGYPQPWIWNHLSCHFFCSHCCNPTKFRNGKPNVEERSVLGLWDYVIFCSLLPLGNESPLVCYTILGYMNWECTWDSSQKLQCLNP